MYRGVASPAQMPRSRRRVVRQAVAALRTSREAVAGGTVIRVPDPERSESVRALIVTRPTATLTKAEVIQHCRDRITSYKKPRSVLFLDELPRLTTSKVNKVLLREKYRG
jgi:acyl-CoA synthetase (AMP-forming)/AMP-acid ligase II